MTRERPGEGSGPSGGSEGTPAAVDGPTRRIDSGAIFRKGERRVLIEHEGREYALLITRNGRLILNRAR